MEVRRSTIEGATMEALMRLSEVGKICDGEVGRHMKSKESPVLLHL